jgi:hypothetical protein
MQEKNEHLAEQVDFSFLSECMRELIEPAYYSLTPQDWDFLKNYEPSEEFGFMFTNNNNKLNIIYNKISQHPSQSGSTVGYTLRCLQIIAKKGFATYRLKCLK